MLLLEFGEKADDSAPEVPAWIGKIFWNIYNYGIFPEIEAAARQGYPIELLLGWPAVESAWNIKSNTKYDERGFFQLMPAESKSLGLDHQLLSEDPSYSFQAGLRLIDRYRNQVLQDGFSEDSALFWPLVKFYHTVGRGGAQAMIQKMRAAGIEPESWDDVVNFVNENPGIYIAGHSADKWVPNPAKVFSKGAELALAGNLSLYTPAIAIPVAIGLGLLLGGGLLYGIRKIRARRSAA